MRVIRTTARALMALAMFSIPALASAQVTPAAGYTPPDDTARAALMCRQRFGWK